jgi:PAS domain S-box-containing protein
MHLPEALETVDPLLCKAIVEQAPEAVIFADTAGIIRIWNQGAEAIFGFAAAEALGTSLDIIVPERFRRAHWAGFQRAMDRGHTQHGSQVRTTRAIHKDGRKLYVDLSFSVIKAQGGAVLGSLGVAREGSARYLAETEQRARIATLEAELASLRPAASS